VIENDADTDGFSLRGSVPPVETEGSSGSGGIFQKRPARGLHLHSSLDTAAIFACCSGEYFENGPECQRRNRPANVLLRAGTKS
jgi:hypothetical protein